MSSVNKRIAIITVVFILLIIFIILFIKPVKEYDSSVLSINYLTDNKDIVVSNSLPMTDEVGVSINKDNTINGITGYIEFEVKSNIKDKVKYELFLIKDSYELEVPVKFVKVYLTDENDSELSYFNKVSVPTFYDLRLASTNPGGRLIYKGFLKNNDSKKFKLRMWVADTYELTAEEVKFSVDLHLGIK